MRKIAPVLAAALVLVFGTTAYAGSVHLKGNTSPSFFDAVLQLIQTVSLSGLGNQDLLVSLTATADVTATCTNPAGATKPPGQNPAPITVTGSEAIPAGQIKNGNLTFSIETQKPTTPIAGAPDCPNSSWSEDITNLSFTTANLTIQQPPGSAPIIVGGATGCTVTFTPSTSDGKVPASDVSCQ